MKPDKTAGIDVNIRPSVSFHLLLSFVAVFFILSLSSAVAADFLTPEERLWLEQHDGRIRVAPDPHFPPIDFFDEKGIYRGISADYLKLVEEMLQFRFQIVRCESFDETLQKARQAEVDLLSAVINTPERSEYLLFTPPYLSISNVMVVTTNMKGPLTVHDLKGMANIVYQKGYAIGDFLRQQGITHARPVIDPETALHDLSMGRIQVMVGNLAVISYYVRKMKIPNLRVAGNCGFEDVLSFAVRKDLPALHSILQKAIQEIPPEKQDAIMNQWLTLKVETSYFGKRFRTGLLVGLILVAAVVSLLYVGNLTLKKQVALKTSELRKREELLARSEEQYRLIAENTADTISVMDLNWNRLYVSPSVYHLRGVTAEEAVQQSIEDILTPESLKVAYSILQQELDIEKRGDADPDRSRLVALEHYRKDGTTVWVENKMTFIRDETGAPQSILVVSRDITERRKAEAALRESENRFRTLALSLNDGILIVDESRRIVFCNRGVEQLTGYTEPELIGKPVETLWPRQYREIYKRKAEDFLKQPHTEYSPAAESSLLHKCGEEIPIDVSMTHWKTDGNSFFGAVVRDLSFKKKKEEYDLLKRKFDTMEVFSGWLAHDMNNLLAGMFGFMELAMDNAGKAEAVKTWVQKAFKSACEARDLIRKFMVMTTAFVPVKRAVNVAEVIQELTPGIRADIRFKFSTDADLRQIDADKEMIASVIKAITDNAQEAMPEGGDLDIVAGNVSIGKDGPKGILVKPGEYVCIKIRDSGCGMDPMTRGRAFDPYFSTKERGAIRGQGLSLPLSYSMIRQHGGHVEILSEQGIGTEVSVWIPAAKHSADIRSDADPKDRSRGGVPARVLVQVDDDTFREMISGMLSKMALGHEFVSRGEDAVELFFHAIEEGNPYGLVILDLRIKAGIGGTPALKIMQSKDPDVRAIVISGSSEDPLIQNYMEYGFSASLVIPFEPEDFREAVTRVMQLPSLSG